MRFNHIKNTLFNQLTQQNKQNTPSSTQQHGAASIRVLLLYLSSQNSAIIPQPSAFIHQTSALLPLTSYLIPQPSAISPLTSAIFSGSKNRPVIPLRIQSNLIFYPFIKIVVLSITLRDILRDILRDTLSITLYGSLKYHYNKATNSCPYGICRTQWY